MSDFLGTGDGPMPLTTQSAPPPQRSSKQAGLPWSDPNSDPMADIQALIARVYEAGHEEGGPIG